MKNEKKVLFYSAVVFLATLAVVLLLSAALWAFTPRPMRLAGDGLFYAKAAITTANIVLLAWLLRIYIGAFVSVKSRFSLGLVFVVVALLAGSFTANPFIQSFFGMRGMWLSPFSIVPELFTLVATAVLFWVSRE